jgi:hypothetical protein
MYKRAEIYTFSEFLNNINNNNVNDIDNDNDNYI